MSSKDQWTKSQTSELISVFKKFPNLYNIKHENYKNRTKRYQAYHLIHEKLSAIKENITVHEIKAKIKTIRNQYTKERGLIKKALKSGDRDRENNPKLWFYNNIRFLDSDNTDNTNNNDYSEVDESNDTLDYIDCSIDDNDNNDEISKNENKKFINDEDLNDEIINESLHEESINNEKLTEERLKYEILPNDISIEEIYEDEDPINDDTGNITNLSYSQINKTKSYDLLEENCRKSLELSQKMAKAFNNINKEKSHLYYFLKSIETDLLDLPTTLQNEAKWKIQNIIREAQIEHSKFSETNKKWNFEVISGETILQMGNNLTAPKRSNIQINSKSISNIPNKIPKSKTAHQEVNKPEEIQTSKQNTVNLSKQQIGTPRIYQVIKPIPKHNSSNNFQQISSTVILGEQSILDKCKRENSPVWID